MFPFEPPKLEILALICFQNTTYTKVIATWTVLEVHSASSYILLMSWSNVTLYMIYCVFKSSDKLTNTNPFAMKSSDRNRVPWRWISKFLLLKKMKTLSIKGRKSGADALYGSNWVSLPCSSLFWCHVIPFEHQVPVKTFKKKMIENK